MPLDPSVSGHLPNVRILAQACGLAYLNEPKGPTAFRTHLGMAARLISVDNSQAYLASDDGALVVAFRGSESPASLDGFKDWLLTNANNLLIVPDGRMGTDFVSAGVGARFHRGFLEALNEIWDPLFTVIQRAWDERERPLWVTGHSLGGALALLAAWRLQRQFLPVHEVVTFGAPMIGNAAAAQAFEREFPNKIFRYVDVEDPVPLLPMISLVANAYCTCRQEIQLTGPNPQAFADALGNLGRRAVEAVLDASLIDEIWSLLRQRIHAHLLPNYLNRLQG